MRSRGGVEKLTLNNCHWEIKEVYIFSFSLYDLRKFLSIKINL